MDRMNLSNNAHPRPSVSERLASLFDALLGWDALSHLFAVIGGLGLFGYVVTAWLLHSAQIGSYWLVALVAILAAALAGFSLARVPAALILLFGGCAILATAFLSGNFQLVLP